MTLTLKHLYVGLAILGLAILVACASTVVYSVDKMNSAAAGLASVAPPGNIAPSCPSPCRCRPSLPPPVSPSTCPSCQAHFFSAQPPGSYVRCPRCSRLAFVENAATGKGAGDLPPAAAGANSGAEQAPPTPPAKE